MENGQKADQLAREADQLERENALMQQKADQLERKADQLEQETELINSVNILFHRVDINLQKFIKTPNNPDVINQIRADMVEIRNLRTKFNSLPAFEVNGVKHGK